MRQPAGLSAQVAAGKECRHPRVSEGVRAAPARGSGVERIPPGAVGSATQTGLSSIGHAVETVEVQFGPRGPPPLVHLEAQPGVHAFLVFPQRRDLGTQPKAYASRADAIHHDLTEQMVTSAGQLEVLELRSKRQQANGWVVRAERRQTGEGFRRLQGEIAAGDDGIRRVRGEQVTPGERRERRVPQAPPRERGCSRPSGSARRPGGDRRTRSEDARRS